MNMTTHDSIEDIIRITKKAEEDGIANIVYQIKNEVMRHAQWGASSLQYTYVHPCPLTDEAHKRIVSLVEKEYGAHGYGVTWVAIHNNREVEICIDWSFDRRTTSQS